MSVVIKSTPVKFKDSDTGQYFGVNALSDKTTNEQLQEIKRKGEECLGALDARKESIEATLPMYAEYVEQVEEVKEHLNDLETKLKSGSIDDAELHLGLYIDADGDICQKED